VPVTPAVVTFRTFRTFRTLRALRVVAIAALAAALLDCSAGSDGQPTGASTGAGSSAGDADGQAAMSGGSQAGSGSASGSGGSGSDSGTSSPSGSRSSGSGGGSGGGGGSGNVADASGPRDASGTSPPTEAGRDASAIAEGAAPIDAARSTADGEAGSTGPTTDELAWLTPMNAARTTVGEMPLTWDPIAAQVALDYASKCVYAHNGSASSEYQALGGSGGLGENIAAGAPTQTIAGAVASWVNEVANYDHATNTCAAGKTCGHYTQVVWSTTRRVGCAQVSCTTGSPFGTFANGQWDYEVCDYNPPGNVNGNPPY
jgi:uncharacterized protein YkwD